jgi:hypothetical protein
MMPNVNTEIIKYNFNCYKSSISKGIFMEALPQLDWKVLATFGDTVRVKMGRRVEAKRVREEMGAALATYISAKPMRRVRGKGQRGCREPNLSI